MRNELYDAKTLYTMIRNVYLATFPESPSRYINQQVTNMYMHALNLYLKEKNIPAKVKFTNTYMELGRVGSFSHNITIEKDLDVISKFPEEKQREILEFINENLDRQKTSIMEDMQGMHRWLVLNDYLSYSDSEKAYYITIAYVDKKELFE
ncbi:hypothetical protein TH60_21590 [Pantoea ananatis]|jgi:hypothetical protein|uniref:hypothetical protein n=1 Tax=Pantoea ananas TaxID=553 RepID=UPI000CF4FC8E|nr:hypothetical protein [Pantoea ananatis]MDC7872087.1 hypothetical protein [Pantoea ananatis]PQK69958.1 hypothetical protein CG427_20555 [Pantoea ananatis]PQK82985.1 hypothetical protein CG431_20500 [Pantoea ananatis]